MNGQSRVLKLLEQRDALLQVELRLVELENLVDPCVLEAGDVVRRLLVCEF